jgi:hypothetical protein
MQMAIDDDFLPPFWKHLLDVVNWAQLFADIYREDVYICPATGGAYSHDRCKYFGLYRKKRVEHIAAIKAVVDVQAVDRAVPLWNNSKEPSEPLLNLAKEKIRRMRPNDYPKRIFLLEPGFNTNFMKDTPGGMRGTKQYFNVKKLRAVDARDLAAKLNGKTWSAFR